jgi:CrcB protein
MADDDTALPIDPDLDPSDPSAPTIGGGVRGSHRRHHRAEPGVLAVIAIGGTLGAAARFELAEALPTAAGHFPWATFWANLSGSFLLGFLLVLLLERLPPTRYLRPFLTTGIIGAYTTMSTFAVETVLLIEDGHAAVGLLYGLGSVAAGLILASAGIVAARLTSHHRDGPVEQVPG